MINEIIDKKQASKSDVTTHAKPEMRSHVKPDVGSNLALGLGLPMTGDSPQSSAVLYENANETSQSLEQKIIASHAIEQKILGDQQIAQRIQEAKIAPTYNGYNKGTKMS